jgi:bacterioferritin-associated ferredoxin
VTDKQIQQAVKNGAMDLADVMEQLDVATNCGSCAEHAEQVIQLALAEDHSLDFDLAYQVA